MPRCNLSQSNLLSRRLFLRQASAGAALVAVLPALRLSAQAPVPPLFGPSGVSPEAVVQGKLGSCYFHATVAAIAGSQPDKLRRALTDNHDETYAVHFVNGKSETVLLEDAAFGRRNGFDLSDGLWVTVLLRGLAQTTMRDSLVAAINATPLPVQAKDSAAALVRSNDAILLAYDRAVRASINQDGQINREALRSALNRQVQVLQINPFFSKPVLDFLDAQGFYEALAQRVQANGELFGAYRGVGQGGVVTTVMSAFAGRALVVPVHRSDETRAYLVRMARERLPAVATTGNASIGASNWYTASHAYTILRFDPSTDTVTLRNPWGDRPEPRGVFSLSFSDFVSGFPYMNLLME